MAAREAGGWAAADAVEPLAGEAGEEGGAVQEPRAAVSCRDAGPQVRLAVIPVAEMKKYIYISIYTYNIMELLMRQSQRFSDGGDAPVPRRVVSDCQLGRSRLEAVRRREPVDELVVVEGGDQRGVDEAVRG